MKTLANNRSPFCCCCLFSIRYAKDEINTVDKNCNFHKVDTFTEKYTESQGNFYFRNRHRPTSRFGQSSLLALRLPVLAARSDQIAAALETARLPRTLRSVLVRAVLSRLRRRTTMMWTIRFLDFSL